MPVVKKKGDQTEPDRMSKNASARTIIIMAMELTSTRHTILQRLHLPPPQAPPPNPSGAPWHRSLPPCHVRLLLHPIPLLLRETLLRRHNALAVPDRRRFRHPPLGQPQLRPVRPQHPATASLHCMCMWPRMAQRVAITAAAAAAGDGTATRLRTHRDQRRRGKDCSAANGRSNCWWPAAGRQAGTFQGDGVRTMRRIGPFKVLSRGTLHERRLGPIGSRLP